MLLSKWRKNGVKFLITKVQYNKNIMVSSISFRETKVSTLCDM